MPNPASTYFDNAATTPLRPEVASWLAQPQLFGNPSSAHAQGRKAAALLAKARAWVAQDLQVDPSWVLFTPSATFSDNLAILGSASAMMKAKGPGAKLHLVCSAFEHPAVMAPMELLARQGHELCVVHPNAKGQLTAQALLDQVRGDTALVSVMAVHNELGLRLPLLELAEGLAAHGARLHCDGVQGIATQALLPEGQHIDLLTLTAHKIGGPKGIGVLVRNPVHEIEPLCVGGGQESTLVPGTENPIMAFAFALALRETCKRREASIARYQALGDRLVSGISGGCPEMVAIRDRVECAGNIVTVCIPGQSGKALVQALDEKGICASAGSACHAHADGPPGAPKLLGLSDKVAKGMLRFSLGPASDEAGVDAVIKALGEILGKA